MNNRCGHNWYWVVQSCVTVQACGLYQAQTVQHGMGESRKNEKIKFKKKKNHRHSAFHVMFILACIMDASNKHPHAG